MALQCYRSPANALTGLRIVLATLPSNLPSRQLVISRRSDSSSSRSSSAPSADRIALNPSSASKDEHHDPLKPRYPTTDLGLPLSPLPLSVPSPSPGNLTTADLERLHRLSALNPPSPGSEEEAELLKGLNELVGLMDLVKAVELPAEDIRGLLGDGVGEVVFDASTDPVESPPPPVQDLDKARKDQEAGERGKKDKELLDWATRRKGDYYAYRSPPRPGST